MAITKKQEPQSFTPAYNEQVHVVDSDNTAEPRFRYVFVVDIKGTDEAKLKNSPDPSFGFGKLDVARIVENYVNINQAYDIDLSTNGFQQNDNAFTKVIIEYGEEYEVASVLTEFLGLDNSQIIYAFNGVLRGLEFDDYDKDDLLILNTSPLPRFLTNQPKTLNIQRGVNRWLYIMINTSTQADRLEVKTYDGINGTGSLLQTVHIDNAFATISTDEDRFLRIDAGQNLNDVPALDLSLGAQPIITTSVLSYTCQMINASAITSSEILTFNIDEICTFYESHTFHFQNRLGGFDSVVLDKRSDETKNITRSTARINRGTLNADGTFTHTKANNGTLQTGATIEDVTTVNSNNLTEVEMAWLEELITSPVVYRELDDELIKINILNAQFVPNKEANGDVFNLLLEFTSGIKEKVQRG